LTDRESFICRSRFGDDYRVPPAVFFLTIVLGRRDDVSRRIDRAAVAAIVAPRLMLAQPPFIAAQPSLQALRGLICAGIGIGGKRLDFEHDAGIEMDHAFGTEAKSLLADGDVAGETAVEIFGGSLCNPLIDPRAQRGADVDV